MNAVITSVSSYLPEKKVTNKELEKTLDTSDEWIISRTGIKSRYIADADQLASDLGYHAASLALKKSNLSPMLINLILVSTVTSDIQGFPSTSGIIQKKIGATNSAALDISAESPGFIYCLECARNFIMNDAAENILVIGISVYSKVIDWTDRNTCVLYGDGAGAVILSKNKSTRGILDSVMYTEGEFSHAIQLKQKSTINGFFRQKSTNMYLTQNGRLMYSLNLRVIPKVINSILERNKLSINDIKYIVPHQSNLRILKSVAHRANIPFKKFFINIENIGNTSAASIPIALDFMDSDNLLKPNDLIITIGYGAGFSYGGNLIKW